jgi:hypothetical protein
MALTDGNAEHSVAENFPLIQVERVCLASAPNYSPTERRWTLPVKAAGTHFRWKIALQDNRRMWRVSRIAEPHETPSAIAT